MSARTFKALEVEVSGKVATVTINNPPINLLDVPLMKELSRLGEELASNRTVHAVIIQSANEEFFIAHGDVGRILEFPVDPDIIPCGLNGLHRIMERWRTLPQATIAKIEGRARGGGSEFALSLDMRFAARGRALLSQPEVALGIIAGGSGTQRASRLLGRGRALEVLLGCADMDADTSELYGYVNRALPADQIDDFVTDLAERIASFPLEAIHSTKQAVDAAWPSAFDGLMMETDLWSKAYSSPDARRRLKKFLEIGGQTRSVELDWDPIVKSLAQTD